MDSTAIKKLNKSEQTEILEGLGAEVIPAKEDDRIRMILKLQENGKKVIEEKVATVKPIKMEAPICAVHKTVCVFDGRDDIYERFSCPKCGRKIYTRWN